jgi:HD-GYP domain-containing protein (c-di-GMP phosphodiesterase class II)/DNA-binding CsgD family transcriptional regulator
MAIVVGMFALADWGLGMGQQSQGGPTRLRLAEVVAALSLATDLGTGQPLERALRTCLLASRMGEEMGLDAAERSSVYYVALLRFVGCTADMEVLATIFGDEQAAQARVSSLELLPLPMVAEIVRHAGDGYPLPDRLRMLAYGLTQGIEATKVAAVAHCEVSQNIAQRLELGQEVNRALGQLYERWDGRGLPGQVKGEAITKAMRLVHIAQDAEVFLRLGGSGAALQTARQRAGGLYDPEMAGYFCRHGARLLAELASESIWESVLEIEPKPHRALSENQLDTAARAIADFTDLRSRFTVGHSSAVAALAFAAAQQCPLSQQEAIRVRRAALLHDVGRTAISLSLWDKAGPLTRTEWERVRLYPYYTERILARPAELADLGSLAALHRERLDGSGYHRGLPAALLSQPARLLAAADVYQSKIEPRAYRPALSAVEAANELRHLVRERKLDGDAVEAVLNVAAGVKAPARREWPGGLSEREVEVLRLLAQGISTRRIADHLSISPKTADHHIQHIYTKIGVSTRAAAILFALQNDLTRD